LQPPESTVNTFPSWKPRRGIDHILVTSTLTALHTHAVPAAWSDHLALAMELEVPNTALAGV